MLRAMTLCDADHIGSVAIADDDAARQQLDQLWSPSKCCSFRIWLERGGWAVIAAGSHHNQQRGSSSKLDDALAKAVHRQRPAAWARRML